MPTQTTPNIIKQKNSAHVSVVREIKNTEFVFRYSVPNKTTERVNGTGIKATIQENYDVNIISDYLFMLANLMQPIRWQLTSF